MKNWREIGKTIIIHLCWWLTLSAAFLKVSLKGLAAETRTLTVSVNTGWQGKHTGCTHGCLDQEIIVWLFASHMMVYRSNNTEAKITASQQNTSAFESVHVHVYFNLKAKLTLTSVSWFSAPSWNISQPKAPASISAANNSLSPYQDNPTVYTSVIYKQKSGWTGIPA